MSGELDPPATGYMLDNMQHTPLVRQSFGHSQALEVEELQRIFVHGAMAALDSNPWSTKC